MLFFYASLSFPSYFAIQLIIFPLVFLYFFHIFLPSYFCIGLFFFLIHLIFYASFTLPIYLVIYLAVSLPPYLPLSLYLDPSLWPPSIFLTSLLVFKILMLCFPFILLSYTIFLVPLCTLLSPLLQFLHFFFSFTFILFAHPSHRPLPSSIISHTILVFVSSFFLGSLPPLFYLFPIHSRFTFTFILSYPPFLPTSAFSHSSLPLFPSSIHPLCSPCHCSPCHLSLPALVPPAFLASRLPQSVGPFFPLTQTRGVGPPQPAITITHSASP